MYKRGDAVRNGRVTLALISNVQADCGLGSRQNKVLVEPCSAIGSLVMIADPGVVSSIPARLHWSWNYLFGRWFKKNGCQRKCVQPLSLSLARKIVVRSTDRLDMAIAVDWDAKPQTKQTNKIKHDDRWTVNGMFVCMSICSVNKLIRCGTWLYRFLIFASLLTSNCEYVSFFSFYVKCNCQHLW